MLAIWALRARALSSLCELVISDAVVASSARASQNATYQEKFCEIDGSVLAARIGVWLAWAGYTGAS
jgi:hypothetical protein